VAQVLAASVPEHALPWRSVQSSVRSTFFTDDYLTKGEAAEKTHVMPADLLDLDPLYGGMHIFDDHLFVSDNLLADGLRRHGSEITLTELVSMLMSEYEFPPRRYSYDLNLSLA
jgi:hypothetical protein